MSQVKFGRNYILIVETQVGGTITIQPPFTVEFDITRNILNSANVASIRIYNLSPKNRDLIGFNIFDQGNFKLVQLFAGYGSNLSTIFSGNINQCWSVREGVNFITQIECFDGGYVYNTNTTNISFPAGTTNAQVIQKLLENLAPTIKVGTVASIPGTSSRGKTYTGSTTDILGQLTNGAFFIDNGFANVLGNNQTLMGPIPTIDDSTGLIGTPVRERTILTFDIIFEPRIVPAQYITLNTKTAPVYNGNYKVNSVKHRGMISDAVCGDLITTVSMSLPALPPGVI